MPSISAGDLEKFCYCPLSWKLRGEEAEEAPLINGRDDHERMGKDLRGIIDQEKRAALFETLVVTGSVLATAFALIGAFIFSTTELLTKALVLTILSILWVVLATLLFYRSIRTVVPEEKERNDLLIITVAIVAIILAVNAFPVLGFSQDQGILVELIALFLLIGASLSMFLSSHLRRRAMQTRNSRRVHGRIAYVGEGGSPRTLRSEKHGLTGRPDFILEIDDELVPVEVKTGRVPRGPLFSHVIQLAAYCLLLEEEGKVSHGILRYGTVEHVIDFDQNLRALLLSKLDQMRRVVESGDVHRDHERPGKCRSCSRRLRCPERLD